MHKVANKLRELAFADVQRLMDAGPSAWVAFVTRWLTGSSNPWMGSQAVQSR